MKKSGPYKKTKCFTDLTLVVVGVLCIPSITKAQRYSSLFETSSITGSGDIGSMLNGIYVAAISAAAIFAVIKIILAGVKYMLSDVVTNKEGAKQDIKSAFLGLIIIVSAVLILETINPKLVNFDLKFKKPEPVEGVLVGGGANQNIGSAVTATYPCAQISGPSLSSSGRSNTTTIDVSGCDPTDATAALAAFADDCRSNSRAKYDTSSSGTNAKCVVPVQQSTTPIEEFAVDDYNDPIFYPSVVITYGLKSIYRSIDGNRFIYRVVDQCKAETGNDNDYNECLYDINFRLLTAATFTDEAGFCIHNAIRNCRIEGNNIVGEAPIWKVKDSDLKEAYMSRDTGAVSKTWDYNAFQSECELQGGLVRDIERLDHGLSYGPNNSLGDYRCVKYGTN